MARIPTQTGCGPFSAPLQWPFASGMLCYPIAMQSPVKERIAKLRDEIVQISEANRLYVQGGKKASDAKADHQRRLQRLQEILDELVALTDWRKL